MPIFHDEMLDELATKKCDIGARADIKKHADEVRLTGDCDIIIRTWMEADRDGAIGEMFNLTFVKIPQALVYFYRPINEVRPLIESAQPKVKAKVGTKVLAKMVAVRIRNLLIEIKASNDNEVAHYNFILKNPNYSGQTPTLPVPHELLGDIDSIARLEEEFDRWAKTGRWGRDRWLRLLRKELLNKPELTDQDVKDGYGMVIAGQVMEE